MAASQLDVRADGIVRLWQLSGPGYYRRRMLADLKERDPAMYEKVAKKVEKLEAAERKKLEGE